MSWVTKIPKIELHVHLEGSIPLNALWVLMEKYGGDKDIRSIKELQSKFIYTDFPHFIETWVWKNQYLREYEDFTYIAEEVAKDFVDQNIVYAEMFHSPSDFFKQGLNAQQLVEAIRNGFNKVPDIQINLVPDLIRDFGPKIGMKTLHKIHEVKEYGVVGITIGGSEQSFPPEPYAEVYEKARDFGFKTSAHAGEAAGPDSVWGAIKALKVDRIGHGTSAIQDMELIDYFAKHQIPVEMCPISNLKTGSVTSIEEHPIRQYFEKGIPISINTDDPKMFGNSLADEYEMLIMKFGFTKNEIIQIQQQSIASSWASDSLKTELADRISNFSL